jgi:uncharacterized lipoprotein YddW (UPF0748 family)
MNVRVFAAVVLVAAVLASPASAQTRAIHAYWVQPASLQSADAVRRMVTTAATNGVTTLFVPVRQASGPFDALAATIDSARERGLRVYAWLDVNLVSPAAELPAAREHVVYQHPEWLMVPRELAPELRAVDARSPEYLGRLARWTRANPDRVDGLYVSPLHAGAQERLAQMITDLVTRYAIDGVHFDSVRFPAPDFDYSRAAVDVFRHDIRARLSAAERRRMDGVEAIDPYAYPEVFSEEWRLFRQTQLTSLVTRLRTAAKAARPGVVVSAAVVSDTVQAAMQGFQDWRTWMDNGFVDALLAGTTPVWARD